jgi:hypothetical protein
MRKDISFLLIFRMKGGDGMRKWVVLAAVLASVAAFSVMTLDTVGNWTIELVSVNGNSLLAAQQNVTAAVVNNNIRYDVASVAVGVFQLYSETYIPQVIIIMSDKVLPVAKGDKVRCQIEYYDRNNKRVTSFTADANYMASTRLMFMPTTVVMKKLQDYNYNIQTVKISFKTNAGTIYVIVDMTYYAAMAVKLAYWASLLGM